MMFLPTSTAHKIFRVIKMPTRGVAVPGSILLKPPKPPKNPPPSPEEYNHLDPKGWQMGAGGKLLPRLPLGAKVGPLVMGKYGLFHPERRRQAERFREAIEKGGKSQTARRFDRILFRIECVNVLISLVIAVWCIAVLITDRMLWPHQNHKPPGAK